MFTRFKNGTVYIVRGDSATFKVLLNTGTNIVPHIETVENGDSVYFGVMEPNQLFENAILRKRYVSKDIVDGYVTINLKPEDTQCLLPGKYFYQIKLEKKRENSNDVYTVVDRTQFFVTE